MTGESFSLIKGSVIESLTITSNTIASYFTALIITITFIITNIFTIFVRYYEHYEYEKTDIATQNHQDSI